MDDKQRQVQEFMKAFGQNTPDRFTPSMFPGSLRSSLIIEEAEEFRAAVDAQDWPEIIDAMCDLLYVVYGAANALGVDLDPFFSEVHRSNMSKLDPNTGKPIYREDGKVMKSASWSAPDIVRVMNEELGFRYLPEEPDSAS